MWMISDVSRNHHPYAPIVLLGLQADLKDASQIGSDYDKGEVLKTQIGADRVSLENVIFSHDL